MIGGEEEEDGEDGEDGEEDSTRDPEDIINNTDYNNLSDEANPSQLSNQNKSFFTIKSSDTVTNTFDITIISESESWATDPDIVTFDTETDLNEVSIYSTNTFSALKDVTLAQGVTNLSGEFNNSIDTTYERESKAIFDEKEEKDRDADDSFQEIYNNSYNQRQNEIQQKEYALNQFQQQRGGFTRKNKSNKFNKTRRITK